MTTNNKMTLETFLKTFSSNTKIMIVLYYKSCNCSGCDVCTVYKKLGIKQANMSKHLSDLLSLGILDVNKDGKERKYKLSSTWYSQWGNLINEIEKNLDFKPIYCDCKHSI